MLFKFILHFVLLTVTAFSCWSQAETHIYKDPTPDFKDDFEQRGTAGGLADKGLLCGNDQNKKRLYARYSGKLLPQTSGTVLFWIKPLDWDKDSPKGNRLFLDARGPDKQLFIINSFATAKGINTLVATIRQGPQEQHIRIPQIDWERGEWHQVAVSYDETGFRFYVDGKRRAERKVPIFQNAFLHFFLGGDPGWTSGIFGNSMLDEFQIFNTPLTDDAIEYLYLKFARDFPAKNIFRIQVNPRTPELDGNVGQGEYSFGGTGFFDLKNQKYASIQSRYFLSYDQNNLYIAVQSPTDGELRASRNTRDGEIWEDDSIELHLIRKNGPYFQFIWNSREGNFDAKEQDRSWNAKNVRTKSTVSDGNWTLECAIPLANFGIAGIIPGEKWRINIARTFQKERLWSSISPCRSRFNDKNQFAEVIFGANPVALDISSFGALNQGILDFQFSASASEADTLDARLVSPQNIFPYAWDEKIALPPGEKITKNVQSKTLPKNNYLSVHMASSRYGDLYQNNLAYEKPDALAMRYIYTDIKPQVLNLVCRCTDSQPLRLRITMLKRKSNEKIWSKEVIAPAKNGEYAVGFPINDLPPGKYDMMIECLDGKGEKLFSRNEYYFKPDGDPEWFIKRDTGMSHEVPEPWTKPVATNNSWECWGQTYKFGGDALLSSIDSRGQELLAAPIRLRVNGNDANQFTSSLKQNLGDMAHYQLSGKASGLRVDADIQSEFDGFLKIDLDLMPDREEIKSAVLEIPLKSSTVDAFDNNQTFWTKTVLPSASKTIYSNLGDMPAFWIGNQHHGLMWGAKNLKGWHTRNLGHSLEIVRKDDSYLLRLHFIDTPLKIMKPRRITFYLQATPVKPLNKKFKNLHKMKNYHTGSEYWVDMYEMHQDEYLRPHMLARISGRKKDFKEVCHYSASYGASPVSPEWNYYGKLWHSPLPYLGDYSTDSSSSGRTREMRDRHTYTYACLGCESFFWFKLNNLSKMILKCGIDNIYADISWPKICSNSEHGCAWTDDFGRSQVSFNVFETRDYYKRLYRVLRSRNPEGVILQHLLGTTRTPAESFTDVLVVGETYTEGVAVKESYYDIFKPVPLKIAYGYRAGEQTVSMLLEFSRALAILRPDRYKTWSPDQPEADRAMKHFLGYCLLHDIEPSPQDWVRKEAYARSFQVYDAEDWLGNYADSEFYPYWDKNAKSPVRLSTPVPETVMLSSRKNGGKVLSTVVNDSDKTVEVSLTFHDFSPKNAFNMFDRKNEQYRITDGYLKIKLGPRDAKLLCITAGGD